MWCIEHVHCLVHFVVGLTPSSPLHVSLLENVVNSRLDVDVNGL